MNRIPVENGDEHIGGNAERRSGREGINMRRIVLPDDSPPGQGEHRGIKLFGIFDPARRRAEAAAQEARLAEQRRLEEVNKQRGIAEARRQIQDQAGGLERAARLPEIGMGARPALARLAERDPARALAIAQKIVSDAKSHNDRLFSAHEAAESAQERARSNRRVLDAHPISTTQVDLTRARILQEQEHEHGILRIAKKGTRGLLAGFSALATVALKGTIATASGKPTAIFDSIRTDGFGIHVDAPFSDVPRVDIGTNLDEYDITANPPPWLDGLVGIASALPGVNRKSVLGWIPFGTVAVRRKVGGKIIAEAPTLFPGARESELKAAAGSIRIPAIPNIQFKPEPTLPDLLGDAANALLSEE